LIRRPVPHSNCRTIAHLHILLHLHHSTPRTNHDHDLLSQQQSPNLIPQRLLSSYQSAGPKVPRRVFALIRFASNQPWQLRTRQATKLSTVRFHNTLYHPLPWSLDYRPLPPPPPHRGTPPPHRPARPPLPHSTSPIAVLAPSPGVQMSTMPPDHHRSTLMRTSSAAGNMAAPSAKPKPAAAAKASNNGSAKSKSQMHRRSRTGQFSPACPLIPVRAKQLECGEPSSSPKLAKLVLIATQLSQCEDQMC
jgi:hypothetical protein